MNIEIGDIVWVAKLPSCGCPDAVGTVFQVSRFTNYENTPVCVHCGEHRPQAPGAFGSSDGYAVELYRLKRIPPLAELEKSTQEEKATA